MFLNFQKVGVFKFKQEANIKIKELLDKHIEDLKEFEDYLLIKR